MTRESLFHILLVTGIAAGMTFRISFLSEYAPLPALTVWRDTGLAALAGAVLSGAVNFVWNLKAPAFLYKKHPRLKQSIFKISCVLFYGIIINSFMGFAFSTPLEQMYGDLDFWFVITVVTSFIFVLLTNTLIFYILWVID